MATDRARTRSHGKPGLPRIPSETLESRKGLTLSSSLFLPFPLFSSLFHSTFFLAGRPVNPGVAHVRRRAGDCPPCRAHPTANTLELPANDATRRDAIRSAGARRATPSDRAPKRRPHMAWDRRIQQWAPAVAAPRTLPCSQFESTCQP